MDSILKYREHRLATSSRINQTKLIVPPLITACIYKLAWNNSLVPEGSVEEQSVDFNQSDILFEVKLAAYVNGRIIFCIYANV